MRKLPFILVLAVFAAQIGPIPYRQATRVARAADDEGSGDEGSGDDEGSGKEEEAAEVAIGERLFLEPRFAQFFHARAGGDVNAILDAGDPVLETSAHPAGDLPGAFALQTMSCRVCHMVDEQHRTPGGGIRAYADFAVRSPVPLRDEDDETATVRNAPTLVEVARRRGLNHFDGEFATLRDLVTSTLTGRNYGWLPSEYETAVAHVAAVIRGDDGRGVLAREFGGPYARLLRGRSPGIPDELHLPRRFRLDVERATDAEVVAAVGRLIAAYVHSLEFAREDGEHVGSPYDRFVYRNRLPGRAGRGSARAYTRRLVRRLADLPQIAFVSPRRLAFVSHDHPFAFGPDELRGFRLFTDRKAGNCAACHPAPRFSDGRFHNTGVSQVSYDAVHGAGAFAALDIPDLATRNGDVEAYLPATPAHPTGLGPFRAVPTPDRPGRVDLGLWNVFQHPDFPERRHQRRLARSICRSMDRAACRAVRDDPDGLLAAATGLFKTPGLRDLGHTAPYFHDGSASTLEDAVAFYVRSSDLARAGMLRNAAPELLDIQLTDDDVTALVAFLQALDEDYE